MQDYISPKKLETTRITTRCNIMKKMIFASILLASLALNATVIIAHRGENRLAPENSIEAANIA